MKKNLFVIFFILIRIISGGTIFAQDFGFGDDENDGGTTGNVLSVSVGGEVSASMVGYFDDFSKGAAHVKLGDVFSGKLNFSAGTAFADGIINLKLQPTQQPVSIDEAYIRAYFGSLEIEGGLRKLSWGKADSFGPLDVINPLDYSELTDLSDMMNLKIARPLVHVSYRIGSFSKIEAVFVPWFEPMRYATEGRWAPAKMKELYELPALVAEQSGGMFSVAVHQPDPTVEYAQAGARFTTTIGKTNGSADIGLQYYYGRLTKPVVTITMASAPPLPVPIPTDIHFTYNPYHQIGVDWAQVLFGFNVRAEFAANITDDLKGDDGSIYNPALLWSFGFDRDLAWGVNINLQCNESIRLMNDKISNDPMMMDIEADTNMTSTQIIAALSKKFFRDELETRFAVLWGIEDRDFFLMPSLVWTRDTVSVELAFGIFSGNKSGQFGQYRDNNFVKVGMSYSF